MGGRVGGGVKANHKGLFGVGKAIESSHKAPYITLQVKKAIS